MFVEQYEEYVFSYLGPSPVCNRWESGYMTVVVQFSPWFRVEFEFPLYFGFVIYMYNNELEESEIEI